MDPLTDKQKLRMINEITIHPEYVEELTEYRLKAIYKHAEHLRMHLELEAIDMVAENPGFPVPEQYQGGEEWRFFLKSTGKAGRRDALIKVKSIIKNHLDSESDSPKRSDKFTWDSVRDWFIKQAENKSEFPTQKAWAEHTARLAKTKFNQPKEPSESTVLRLSKTYEM